MSLDPRFHRPDRGVERSGVQRRRRYRLVLALGVVIAAAAVIFTVVAYQFLTHPDRFVRIADMSDFGVTAACERAQVRTSATVHADDRNTQLLVRACTGRFGGM